MAMLAQNSSQPTLPSSSRPAGLRRLLSWPARVIAYTVHHTPGGTVVYLLAAIAMILQELDLYTGTRMMERYGLAYEQNPFARALFATGGPILLEAAKLGVVLSITYLMLRFAKRGRVRLARNTLWFIAILGLLGLVSNLV
jgi:hypothetical protein